MPREPGKSHYDIFPLKLDAGVRLDRHPANIAEGESPFARNIDFDRNSLKAVGGAIKFGNRRAPASALRTKVDPALAPLSCGPSYIDSAVYTYCPLRGYGFLPYNEKQAIGGDYDTQTLGSAFTSRRGQTFEINCSFRLPDDEKLYSAPTNASAAGASSLSLGYDQALDECTIIMQGGGDRLTPMSWAIGIVNTGTLFETLTGASAAARPSNYALVFMWLDYAEFSHVLPEQMAYALANSSDVDASPTYSTLALRAVVCGHFVEPGKQYHVAFRVGLDTGAPSWNSGTSKHTTSWNENGSVEFVVLDGESMAPATYYYHGSAHATPGTSGLYVWKGPTDSLDYLAKYGVRYSGRDAMFLGLGYRCLPAARFGFIPYGYDGASVDKLGWTMFDRSTKTVAELGIVKPLLVTHAGANAYVTTAEEGLVYSGGATVDFGYAPFATNGFYALYADLWYGLNGTQFTVFAAQRFNAQALRGYRLVFTEDTANERGGLLNIESYAIVGGQYRITVTGGAALGAITDGEVLVQAFRWNQRPMEVCNVRIYSALRDYTDPHVVFSLQSDVQLTSTVEPGRSDLKAYWPCDDAGGGTLRELMHGNDGYLAPFGLGQSETGVRGKRTVFLSGEGESIVLDLSENPIFQREMARALESGQMAFAIEFTGRFPEASYGRGIASAGYSSAGWIGKYGPTLCAWEVKSTSTGFATTPRPLLVLTQRVHSDNSSGLPTAMKDPLGFTVLYGEKSDQDSGLEQPAVLAYETAANKWNTTASWVGKPVTVQVGVQSTGVADEYKVYIAVSPKEAFKSAAGDPDGGELAYYSTATISKKDLVRSIITIGGRWSPTTQAGTTHTTLGYTELNARLILDEVRVFGAAAPGALPASSGGIVTAGTGKLFGQRCLPTRELELEDILLPLGNGIETANVTEGSASVSKPGLAGFFTAEPEDTIDAVKETFVYVAGDTHKILKEQTAGSEQDEFYYVSSATASTLTLATPYSDPSKTNASVRSLRLIGYSALNEDLWARQLTIGQGAAFQAGTSTSDNALLTPDLFANLAPVSGNFKLRLYSPLGHSSAPDILPSWVQGLNEPRRNTILGVTALEGRMYAATDGCVYEVDDRWSTDAPNGLDGSLSFREKRDRVEMTSATSLTMTGATLTNDRCWIYDAWVKLDRIGDIQTIMWVGENGTDPSLNPGTSATTHHANSWVRLWRGQPQFCLFSTSNYSGGGAPPDKGLYVATAARQIPLKKWTHVRWYVPFASSEVRTPVCAINGKIVGVTVNTVSTGLVTSNGWLLSSGLVSLVNPVLMLGAARDSVLSQDSSGTIAVDSFLGRELNPQRLQGLMHGLDGKLCGVALHVGTVSISSASATAAFNPYAITYAGSVRYKALAGTVQGAGHKVLDESVGAGYGTIYSHPFIGLKHNCKRTGRQWSFGRYGARAYATHGDRPIYIQDGAARFAGVLPPTVAPTFVIERKPLWATNVEDTDPLSQVAAGTDPKRRHFSNHGNNYLRQQWHDEMKWTKDGTNRSLFGFKCLIKMREVSGRIPIYSARGSVTSGGPVLEIRDGELFFGWYDKALKSVEGVTTEGVQMKPGAWYYVYVRKNYPQQSGGKNWINSILRQTATVTNDVLVVREFMTAAPNASYSNWPTIGLKEGTSHAAYNDAGGEKVRNCISFTTSDQTVAGCTVTGIVSDSTVTYTGAAGGVINADGGAAPFYPDMLGMLFQFGNAANSDKTVYRIVSMNGDADSPGTQITVVNQATGANPNLAGANYAGKTGAVATGIALKKSTNFDSANSPDDSPYAIELFGSQLSEFAQSGVAKFNGEFDSFAYVCVSVPLATTGDIDVFETGGGTTGETIDDILIGSDYFDVRLDQSSAAASPGPVQADSGDVFACVHTSAYGWTLAKTAPTSTQPNQDLEVALDATKSTNASPLFWKYLLAPDITQERRKVSVTFWDDDQKQMSNPGPELEILPSAEDKTNPSGLVRILLSSLPVSPQEGNVHRYVYSTLSGGEALLLAAAVPDNTSTSVAIVATDSELASDAKALPISYTNAAPPRCNVLAASQNRIFYGGLIDFSAGDTGAFSKGYLPGAVIPSSLFQVTEGRDTEIRAMAEHRGRLFVAKRDACARFVVTETAIVREGVSSSAGCVSPQGLVGDDETLFMVGERGLYGYNGSGSPQLLDSQIQPLFEADGDVAIDLKALDRISAAPLRMQRQIIVAFKQEGDEYQCSRFSCELTGDGARYGLQRWPCVTSMCVGLGQGRASNQLIAGTDDGYMVWLGRTDTPALCMGPSSGVWGAQTGLIAGSSTTATMIGLSSGSADVALAGPGGSVARWLDSSGDEQEALILGSFTGGQNKLLLVEEHASPPAVGTALTLGAAGVLWESKWTNLDLAYQDKRLRFLDLLINQEASGTVQLEVYQTVENRTTGAIEYNETDKRIDKQLTLVGGVLQVPLNEAQARAYKFVLRSKAPNDAIRLEILSATLRYTVVDQN